MPAKAKNTPDNKKKILVINEFFNNSYHGVVNFMVRKLNYTLGRQNINTIKNNPKYLSENASQKTIDILYNYIINNN